MPDSTPRCSSFLLCALLMTVLPWGGSPLLAQPASAAAPAGDTRVCGEIVPPGAKLQIRVPHMTQSCLVYASGNGPFVLLNGFVYSLQSGKQVGQVPVSRSTFSKCALSPDGGRLAIIPLAKAEVQILRTDAEEGDTGGEPARTIQLGGRSATTVAMSFLTARWRRA